jgi:acetylornithine/succinyldiaminopimelate/putrescine aminotransferase/predicted amino acid dehydrogenase
LKPGGTLEEALALIAQANETATRQEPTFFALERAFHGKTASAVQLTYNAEVRRPFSRIGVRCEFLPADEPAAWERALARASSRSWEVSNENGRLHLREKRWVNVSAILIEPIQGEGGVHVLSPETAAHIRALANDHGIPLIIDEIQTGLGRTGTFLASETLGIRGDYYAFAKGLGGGLTKVGALAIDTSRYCADFGVLHTSTFSEDDLSSRVGVAALALLEKENIPSRCAEVGHYFLKQLQALVTAHPTVFKEARGRGLMLGLELCSQAHNVSNVIRMLSEHGYLGYVVAGYLLHEDGFRVGPTLSSTATIRLEPSAFLPLEAIDRFIQALMRLATVLERGNAYRLTRYVVGLAESADPNPIQDFRAPARPLRREAARTEKRVAFIGHFITAQDAILWDPSLGLLPPGKLESYQLATYRIFGPTIYDQLHVTSALGETVHLSFIGINVTSKSIEAAMRIRDTDWIVRLVEEGVAKARTAGCQVVGLGGFTSIVTDNGRKIGERGVTLTTGNALTVGMGLAALKRGAEEQGLRLEASSLGIIGAAGNIGAIYATLMAEEVPRLVLIGREGGNRLQRIANQILEDAFRRLAEGLAPTGIAGVIEKTRMVKTLLAQSPADWGNHLGARLAEGLAVEMGDRAPILVTSDLDALGTCRLIVCASNSAKPLVYPRHLSKGPVVICDISVPADVALEVSLERPDVNVILGGLVKVPQDPGFRVGGIPLPDGHAFACMSETLLLGLMGVREHFSYGPITPMKVRQAMAWAALNGFELGAAKQARSY